MARIVLINPWIYDFAAANLWVRPLGLLQVAEYLSATQAELALVDCLDVPTGHVYHKGRFPKTILPPPDAVRTVARPYGRYGISLDDFRSQLKSHLPADVFLVTSLMTYWYPGVQAVIQECRSLAPGVPVLLGGLYPRLFPEHAAAHSGADAIYTKPVDDSLLVVLRGLGLHLERVRPTTPYYQLSCYSHQGFAALLTAQGCPFRCDYCAGPMLSPGFHPRPAETVVQEIDALRAQGVEDFAFFDDALLYQAPEHLHPILEAISDHGPAVRFHTPNGLHARFLDATTAPLMKRAGFTTIRLSLETVNTRRQKESGDKVVTSELESAVQNLRQAGFSNRDLGVYLLYGLPHQPQEELWEGIRFLETLGVRIHLNEFSPLPGTKSWQDLVNEGRISPDLDPLLTNNTVYSQLFSGYSPETLRQLKDTVAKVNQQLV